MAKKKTPMTTVRIRVLFVLILLAGSVLASRLYLVQVVYSDDYKNQADHQYVQPNYNVYDRGTIYLTDRDGEQIPAAMLQSGFLVAVNPSEITNPETVFQKLSSKINLEREFFMSKANKKDDPYEVLAKQLPQETAEAIANEDIPGIHLSKQQWRYYPGGTMAAHSLGFVGYQGNELAGRYGLERQYEETLMRSNDKLQVNFFAQVFANIKETVFHDKSLTGDVVTGLEPNVQAQLEEQLEAVNDAWSSRYSGGIVMNPRTGQVYAMAVTPSFDPNDRSSVDDPEAFNNPLVESVYEFGSIVKPLTMAIGIDTGAVSKNTTYVDTGSLTLDGYTIANYDNQARGRVDMQEVLNQSLNTGAAFIARQVGNEKFGERMASFLIGEKTGIDLPNEATGIISNLESARDVEIATASFGQGIAMSPMAATRALAALANGGTLVSPHIATRVRYDIGGSSNLVPEGEKIRVISTSTSKTITRMLVDVVDEALVNGEKSRENYSIAAKTGTAQISKKNSRGYYENRFLHSFFGYAPAYDPRFIVFLYTVEPNSAVYASQTLTDPFMSMMDYLINYYNVPPDR